MKLNPDKFKELKAQASKEEAKLETAEKELKKSQQQVDYHTKQLDWIAKQLAENLEVTLSDHALVRYVERRNLFDIDKIKSEIMTTSIKKQIETIGRGKIPLGDDLIMVVKNNVVVSIIPKPTKGREKLFNKSQQNEIKESYHETDMNVPAIARRWKTSETTIHKIIDGKY